MRKLLFIIICLCGCLIMLLFSGAVISAPTGSVGNGWSWFPINQPGFGDSNNFDAMLMGFEGRLYAGTDNPVTGGEVWSYDGTTWTRVDGGTSPGNGGFGDTNNGKIRFGRDFNGQLYAGTDNSTTGGEVWSYDGTTWTRVDGGTSPGNGGFGDSNNVLIVPRAVFNGELYAGTQNSSTGGEVWSYDGTTWTRVDGGTSPGNGGFGDSNNGRVFTGAIFNDKLYVGTFNSTTGSEVWSYDGTTWIRVDGGTSPGNGGFGDTNNMLLTPSAVFEDKLYVGTLNTSTGGEVWSYDGTTWTRVDGGTSPGNGGFGDIRNAFVVPVAIFEGKLYAGTYNTTTGSEVWSYDGTTWTQANTDGFGDRNNSSALSLAVFDGKLYAGVRNTAIGTEVWKYPVWVWKAFLPLIMKNHPTPMPTPTPAPTPTPTVENVSGTYNMVISNPWDNCEGFDMSTGEDAAEVIQEGTTITFITSQGEILGEIGEDLSFEVGGTTFEGDVCRAGCTYLLEGVFIPGDPMTFTGSGSISFLQYGCFATFLVDGTRTGP